MVKDIWPTHLELRAPDVLPDGLEDGAHDEDVVEDGEAGEETVEDGAHLLGQQDRDGDRVRHEAEEA